MSPANMRGGAATALMLAVAEVRGILDRAGQSGRRRALLTRAASPAT